MNRGNDVLSPKNWADVELLWDFHLIDSGRVTADLMVVLGSHDMRVADRAAELYTKERAAPLIIVTGGTGKITQREWKTPEAEVYAARMASLGVPEDSILVEPLARNTGQNFEFARELARRSRVKADSGIIVSKPYMACRSLAVARKVWPNVVWYNRPPLIPLREYPADGVPLRRMVNLMVGDLQRVRIYAEQGFQAPVEVPERVWAAYRRLVKEGFDDFVIR